VGKAWKYILDGRIPVPCEDLLAWAEWFEHSDAERTVRQEEVGPYWVSTVFLGLDHNYGRGPPRLFETMVFKREGDPLGVDLDTYREATWELALERHRLVVRDLEDRLRKELH